MSFESFPLRPTLRRLAEQYSIPAAPLEPRRFNSRLEQMRVWIADPILRAEAEVWAARNGYDVERDEYGSAIGIEEVQDW